MYAVVTGASRGIGKAIARIFALNGYDLLLTSQNESTLLQTVDSLKKDFPDVTIDAQALDIGVKQKAILFAEWAAGKAETIDVLVNNAGTFLPGNVSDEADGTLEKIMEVNLYSAYHITRALLPKMKAQGHGHIFNMCSIAGLQAYPNGGSYSISKAALHAFSKNLRHELMPHGIKVTAIFPGAVYTDSWAPFVGPERIMEVEDIAQMVYAASRLSPQAVVEDIILRPQLGDL
ncbi:MAG: SDR family oxidoreductase [Chitinophagaceae bacterium]